MNIVTCLVAVMMRGVNLGCVGSWAAVDAANAIDIMKTRQRMSMVTTSRDELIVMKKPSGTPDGSYRKPGLVGEERSAQGLVATAATAVFPLHLDHPVMTAEGLIEP